MINSQTSDAFQPLSAGHISPPAVPLHQLYSIYDRSLQEEAVIIKVG